MRDFLLLGESWDLLDLFTGSLPGNAGSMGHERSTSKIDPSNRYGDMVHYQGVAVVVLANSHVLRDRGGLGVPAFIYKNMFTVGIKFTKGPFT